MDHLSNRLQKIRQTIQAAASRTRRKDTEVELIAVSKTQLAESVREAMGAGLTHFGENKVQEARGKIEEIGRGIRGTPG